MLSIVVTRPAKCCFHPARLGPDPSFAPATGAVRSRTTGLSVPRIVGEQAMIRELWSIVIGRVVPRNLAAPGIEGTACGLPDRRQRCIGGREGKPCHARDRIAVILAFE